MLFHVHRLRDKGRVIPRHHILRLPGTPGEFVLEEESDRETCRRVRVARLRPLGHQGGALDLLPPLVDATLIYAKASIWTVPGFERQKDEPLYEPAYLQSWLMRPFSPEEAHEVLTDGTGPELGGSWPKQPSPPARNR
jgi:hypothetical protein